MTNSKIAVLGAGFQGAGVALELARRGAQVDVYERLAKPIMAASMRNEGKIHLGLVYASDSSMRSIDTMLCGALCFESVLRRWIDVSPGSVRRSKPFLYLVHAQSGMAEADLAEHFREVSRRFAALCQTTGQAYFGTRDCLIQRWPDERCTRHFDPDCIVAAYETPEISIGVEDIAERLRVALVSEPRVTLHTNCEVERVSRSDDDSLAVHIASGKRRYSSQHSHVVNACWAGRLAIDESMGVQPKSPWSFRYKLGVFVEGAEGMGRVPSSTIVAGSFGDIVNYGDGALYLSWYPECMLGMTTGITPPRWDDDIPAEVRHTAVRRTLEKLGQLCPDIKKLSKHGTHRIHARGGVIYALGATDIDDPKSQLHERHRIGVHSYGNYHTIDTGKYTTAPMFALDVCDAIVGPTNAADGLAWRR